MVEKPKQEEKLESKQTDSVGADVFMRYIRAGGCGMIGLSCLFALFALTSAIILYTNWWLGHWSNSENIRYSSTLSNCSSYQQSKINLISSYEWFEERNKLFYIFLGK